MEDVALKYVLIVKEFVHNQNGEVSSGMQKLGLNYKINYGLSIPIINKIACSIHKNNDLAIYCWKQEIRESKLLAIRLFDSYSISQSSLNEILAGINNIELAEQAAFNLFVNLSDNLALLHKLLNNGNEFVGYSGLLTILRILKSDQNFNYKNYDEILNLLKTFKWINKPYLKRAFSDVLINIGLKDKLLEQKVMDWINEYAFDNHDVMDYFNKEVLYYFEN
jgi:3-methyladenine DNA glycosylase AlkD